jgi:hypothetical protein
LIAAGRRVRRRPIASGRRPTQGVMPIHAAIVDPGVATLDRIGGCLGIARANSRTSHDARTSTNGRPCASVAPAKYGTQSRPAQKARNGTACLCVACGLTRRHIAGGTGGLMAADHIP